MRWKFRRVGLWSIFGISNIEDRFLTPTYALNLKIQWNEHWSVWFYVSIVKIVQKTEFSWNRLWNLNWNRFDGSQKMLDGIMDFVCAYLECNQGFLNWYVRNIYSKNTALDLMSIKWQPSRFLTMKECIGFARAWSDMVCSEHNESDERPRNWNETEAEKESEREKEAERAKCATLVEKKDCEPGM